MLIASTRHRPNDLERWAAAERVDAVHCWLSNHRRRVAEAVAAVRRFADDGPCYAGVSWGKDSVVLAHLLAEHAPDVPLACVRVEPIANPDCALVRDAFLARHPGMQYVEMEEWCALSEDEVHESEVRRTPHGSWIARGTLERGLARVAATYGERYLSGVRADESAQRSLRCKTYGVSTARTCAPLAWWTAANVFAYLHEHGLPVHPAYACAQGGLWPRERIRVASLGGARGAGHGRAEWERRYYPEMGHRLRIAAESHRSREIGMS